MRRVRFFYSADEIAGANLAGDIAVVADVLRATSTIVTALANGCEKVIPVEKVEEARQTAAALLKDRIILGGERKGEPIDGFDFGNSPQDYTPEKVSGKTVITTTTNGTKALVYAHQARQTLVLSLLNLGAVADYLLRQKGDIALVAAGIYGEYSIEDSVCCGLLLDRLMETAPDHFLPDEAALQLLEKSRPYKHNVRLLLEQSPHGDFLRGIGYESDLAFCAHVDAMGIVPIYKNGFIATLETI